MIKKISIFLLIFGICLFCYILYKGSAGPVLSLTAVFTSFGGGFSLMMEKISKEERWRIFKLIFCYLLAVIFFALIFAKIGGENLGKINYWPVICGILLVFFSFLGSKYLNSSHEETLPPQTQP